MKLHSNLKMCLKMNPKISALVCVAVLPAMASAKSTVIKTEKSLNEVVGQWMAAGSGCQASSDKPGDVELLSVEKTSDDAKTGSKVYTVTFSLPKYKLRPLEKTETRPKVSLTNYARECAIRLNVNPAKGFALSSVTANSELEVSKDSVSKLLVQASLKLGATTITKQLQQFPKEEAFNFRSLVLDLMPGRNPDDELPQSECEAKKIVGLDFTFLTNKDNDTALAEARIAKGGEAKIVLNFEPCGSGRKN